MIWLNLAIVLVLALLSAFGASFLTSAWRRLKKAEPGVLRLEAMLPGYDCGLCGRPDCRTYAAALDAEGADPALCLPGGSALEARLRSALAERPGDRRGSSMRAVVRCRGYSGVAAADFLYDGRSSCRSVVGLYGGPKSCKEGCIGFGSCAAACPLGAIRLVSGVAVVDPARCSGCGECLPACPTGVISLVPRGQDWYVACSARREPASRSRDCPAACTGCGDCVGRSARGEFRMEGSLARENPDVASGRWQDLAAACPTGAIALAGEEKKPRSPFPGKGR